MIFWKKRPNPVNIKLVNDQDLKGYLNSLGVLKDIEEGNIRCEMCGEVLGVDEIEVIFPIEGRIAFVCSNPKCIDQIPTYDS